MSADAQIRLRRSVGLFAVALLLAIDVFATGLFGGGERTLAIVRSIVLPGLPFLEWSWLYGTAAIITALYQAAYQPLVFARSGLPAPRFCPTKV